MVLGFYLTANAYAIPHWLGPAFELCKVTQNAMFYHHTRDGEKDSWKIEKGKIILKKEDYLSAHKSKGKRKFYAGSSAAFPAKNDVYDKIVMIGESKGIEISNILDCQKYKPKLKKIKYNTYNIFTQEDLFNGLKDNEKNKSPRKYRISNLCKM